MKLVKATVSQSAITDVREILQVYSEQDRDFSRIAAKIKSVTKRNVYPDFSFKSGAILGIVKAVAYSKLDVREKLLKITGLDSGSIKFYHEWVGRLSYLGADNQIVEGKDMKDIQSVKAFVIICAEKLGIFLSEDDISDLTEDNWNRLVKENAKKVRKQKSESAKLIVPQIANPDE